jgi:hypothetical protein
LNGLGEIKSLGVGGFGNPERLKFKDSPEGGIRMDKNLMLLVVFGEWQELIKEAIVCKEPLSC